MAIATTGASSIYVDANNGTTMPVDLSILYLKPFYVRLAKKLSMINASILNPETIRGGTAIYYKGRANIVKNYDGTQAPDAVHTTQILVQIDQTRQIQFSYETLDIDRLGAKLNTDGSITVGQAFLDSWLGGAQKSAEAYLFARITKGIVDACSNSATPTIINLPSNDSDGNPINDVDKLRAIWRQVADRLAELQGLVSQDHSIFGLDMEDFTFMVSPKLLNVFILATSTLGGDSSRNALLEGEIMKIGGINILVNPYLGNTYATTYLAKEEAFDFTAVDGILIHKESYGFPYVNGSVGTNINYNNLNPVFVHKFALSSTNGAIIRPLTIQGFKIVNES